MILKRFYDEKLAQASYLIGCGAKGEAVVIDPNRDVNQYLKAAEAESVRITGVTETHIHADFVSGTRELASRTGARMYLSKEGGSEWQYEFGGEADTTLLAEGDEIVVGNVVLKALHTPGHTPEHLSFLVTDRATGAEPIGILTGDFVFVGDVGRPDLLERAARIEGTMEAGARDLFASIQRFRKLPDHIQIWPGHGAGSACGKGLSSVPTSTVGYEKLYNWALNIDDEDEFVTAVLEGQPDPPKYFAEMKMVNRAGPAIIGGRHHPQRLAESRLEAVVRDGGLVIDTRSPGAFATGHIPDSVNIPLGRNFNTWAGWLVPYDRDFYLIIDDSCMHCMDEASRDLSMIGLDRVAGYFGADVLEAWTTQGNVTEDVSKVTGIEVAGMLGDGSVQIVDVRNRDEWEEGHVPGSINIPVGRLSDQLDRLDRDRPVVVHCQTGGRSAIAASLLEKNGFEEVLDYSGGFGEWRAAKREVVVEG